MEIKPEKIQALQKAMKEWKQQANRIVPDMNAPTPVADRAFYRGARRVMEHLGIPELPKEVGD